MKNYNDLSSKERFFRTLWFLPIALAVLAAVLWFFDDTSRIMNILIGSLYIKLIIMALVTVLGIAQLANNYTLWKREGIE